MNITIDHSYVNFEKHIHYTVDVLLQDVLGIDRETPVEVFYGHKISASEFSTRRIIQIIPSDFFTKKTYLSPDSLPQSPMSWVGISKFMPLRDNFFEPQIPVLYWGKNERKDVLFKKDNLIVSMADIIASAFFLLTRYEEMIVKERDKYDRFPAGQSIAFRERFLHRPIVHEYAELLWDWIKTLAPAATRREKTFKVRLTHDIDMFGLHTSLVKKIARIPWELCFKEEKVTKVFQRSKQGFLALSGGKKGPYDRLEQLMDISEDHGLCSYFYIMADNVDAPYKISDRRVMTTIQNILSRGHEIGLHPNFGTYTSYKKLARQKNCLDKVLGYKSYGGRQHYLQWSVSETWRLYEEVGLTHDSSIGFTEMPGFRAGICVPYRAFDLKQGRRLSLVEIPLIVMDASVYSTKFDDMRDEYFSSAFGSGLSIFNIIDYVHYLKTETKRHKGCFTVLWHNNRLRKSQEVDYRGLISG